MEPGIALFGGVFDPPHRGHLALARAAADALGVEIVHFLVAGIPPHKPGATPAPPGARRAMLELAIAGDPRLRVDARELEREGPSYTILTLQEIHQEHPGRKVYFLIGSDDIRSIGTWHQAERLFRLADVVVMPRPGEPSEFRPEDVPFLTEDERRALNAAFLDPVAIPASSTEIRERVRTGRSISELVPAAVERYIVEHGLYR